MSGCRVYWGSHGCNLQRGHDGPCRCDCADDPGVDPETREYVDDPGCFNVGAPPYYGPDTAFYGEDALDVMGRVDLPGIIVSATPTRVVVSTPGAPEEWSKQLNDAGEWEPWDVYAQTLDAPSDQRLEVREERREPYPGHLVVAAVPLSQSSDSANSQAQPQHPETDARANPEDE